MLAEAALRRLGSLQRQLVDLGSVTTTLQNTSIDSLQAMGGAAAQHTSGMSSKRRRVGSGDEDESIFICTVARTPLGSLQGSLSHLSATDLGSIAIKSAVERANLSAEAIQEIYMGNVCSAGLGQAPARQAALKAGLPVNADATTVNKVCSSGIKSIALGAQSIALGLSNIVVAGGMESMSNIPYYDTAARKGARLGHATLTDGMLHDGLWDATYQIHMGDCAELCAEKYGISRDAQDAHAIESVARAKKASADGTLNWEIVPVHRSGGSKPTTSTFSPSNSTNPTISKDSTSLAATFITEDEAMAKMNPEKLKKLAPFFKTDGNGTVTAGNASPITDGAAAVVLASKEAVTRYNLPVLGRILGFADAAQDPKDFPTSPALAVPLALKRAGVRKEDVDYWEINEAFSVVDLVNQKLLGLDYERVNVFGGAVALGHPIGASGCRLVVTLLNVLRAKGGKVGVAAICNGGGGATAMVIENCNK